MSEFDFSQYVPAALEPYLPYVYGFGYLLLATWLFWALYVFVMGLYRAELDGRLVGLNRVLGYPIFIFALVLDIVFNWVVAPVVFLDLPRETLVTSRLQRYMAGPDGWRKNVAKYICDHVLDVFDPKGDHC